MTRIIDALDMEIEKMKKECEYPKFLDFAKGEFEKRLATTEKAEAARKLLNRVACMMSYNYELEKRTQSFIESIERREF